MKTGFFYGCSLLLAALSLMLTSCKTANKTGGKLMPDAEEATVLASEAAMPHVIVYKTSKDYSRNVPVVLDDSRSVIVSYPAPTDVTPSVFLPVSLDKGYWLDRKGISANPASFLQSLQQCRQCKLHRSVHSQKSCRSGCSFICSCLSLRAISKPKRWRNVRGVIFSIFNPV